jgi:hypothetical protein
MCLFALEDSTYFRNQFQSTGQPLTLINILNEEDQWTLDLEGNVLLNQYDLQEYYRLEMISVENEIALFKCRRLNPDSQKKYKVYLEINLENHQIQILWSKRKLHSTYYLIFCSQLDPKNTTIMSYTINSAPSVSKMMNLPLVSQNQNQNQNQNKNIIPKFNIKISNKKLLTLNN